MKKTDHLKSGDRVRIKRTGQEVTVDQVSEYGFSVIKFNSGGTYRFLNNQLEKDDSQGISYNA